MHAGVSIEEIITGCKRNNRKYQEILYRRYFQTMMRMCMRYTKDPELAMTIVNDGFLKVFKHIDKYEERGQLKSWIHKIVFRALSDHFRKDSRRLQFLELETFDKSGTEETLPELYMDELLKLVEELPDINRKVFTLYAVQGYSHKEISELLDINENTSKWYLAKARKQLRARIELEEGLSKRNGA